MASFPNRWECDQCGFTVQIDNPIAYLKEKRQEMQEWLENNPCVSCRFEPLCMIGKLGEKRICLMNEEI